MAYLIRLWSPKDLKDIMQLIREAAAFHKALDKVKTTPEVFQKDGSGNDATFGFLVAEVPAEQKSKEGHKIVGYHFHYVTYCTWGGPVLFGEDLYVMPEFRGRGIGTSLLNKAVKMVEEKGCNTFRFISAGWNQPAMDFFTKLGAANSTFDGHWHLWHLEGDHLWKVAERARKWKP